MKNPDLVTQALLVVLILVVGWMAFHGGPANPATPAAQPPQSPLAAAARQHHDSEGATYALLADQVRRGQVTTKAQAAATLAGHAKPLGDALNAAYDRHSDKDGTITDAIGLEAELNQAAAAVGTR